MDRAACKGMVPSRRAPRGAGSGKVGEAKKSDEPVDLVDPFFPGRNQPVSGAQRVCLSCPVWRDCKSYGKRTGAQYGVWAGELKKRPKSPDGTQEEEDDE